MTLMGLTGPRGIACASRRSSTTRTYPNPRDALRDHGLRPAGGRRQGAPAPAPGGRCGFAWGCADPSCWRRGLGVDARRDPRGSAHEAARHRERSSSRYGTVRAGHPRRAALRAPGHGRRRAAHRDRTRHTPAPEIAPVLAGQRARGRRMLPPDPDPTAVRRSRRRSHFRGAGDDPNAGGCLSTGMRAIQAIPAVCAAPPGLLSALDLPLIPGRGNMR